MKQLTLKIEGSHCMHFIVISFEIDTDTYIYCTNVALCDMTGNSIKLTKE